MALPTLDTTATDFGHRVVRGIGSPAGKPRFRFWLRPLFWCLSRLAARRRLDQQTLGKEDGGDGGGAGAVPGANGGGDGGASADDGGGLFPFIPKPQTSAGPFEILTLK